MYKIEKFKVGDVGNCTYMVFDPEYKNAVLVDPAWDANKIEEFLYKLDLSLKGIILTHSHYDHTNLVQYFAEKFNCNVYMSKHEVEFYKFSCVNLISVDDDDIINVDNLSFTCILTPGHTIGSMCFKIDNNLFTGDTLFIRGCGFCNCYGGSIEQMFNSINRLKDILKGDVLLYPGHYFRDDLEHEKEYMKKNIYLHIKNKKLFRDLMLLNGKSNKFLNHKNFD